MKISCLAKINQKLPQGVAYLRCEKNTFSGFDKHYDQDAKFCTVVLVLDEEGDPNFRAKGVDKNSWRRIRNKLIIIPASSEHWVTPIF